MASKVIDRILEQCRTALVGGTPILYIKTDSAKLIQQIVEEPRSPLVVPICSSAGGTQYAFRPIEERRKVGKEIRGFVLNCKEELPKSYEMIKYPYIWYFKMPEGVKAEETLKILEKYVMDHEDPAYPAYSILQSSVVLVYSSEVVISSMLRPYTEFIEVGYPDEEEIRSLVIEESGADPILTGNDRYLSRLCTDFLGFTAEEIVTTMKKVMANASLEDSKKVEAIIFDYKKQKMQGGVLEFCSPKGAVGGMVNFREWLNKQVDPLINSNVYKRKTGTLPPKGVLLCGIPGCGKSEAAKFTAHTLNLPLLKMDVGSLMDKYQGVSEQRMREALKMAESMSPCVLWIDELEKGFSGAGSNDDSASFKRMFGYMLGWMQDNQKPCFIFATANDIGGLPKEFFRNGRFDGRYAVYLPTAQECVSIFKACMSRAMGNIADAKHISKDVVKIFEPDCMNDNLYYNLLNKELVHANGIPRIIIGSDIQAIVNIALRTLVGQETITALQWQKALQEAVKECNVYGDGEENVDSIAVSYCRMLRKNFTPTADKVLFEARDYCVNNVTAYERLKRMSTVGMTEEEEREHEKKLRDSEILQYRVQKFTSAYDEAVYEYLRERINDIALPLEKRERERLIAR